MMKVCSDCKTQKPLTAFHKDRSRKDGLKYRCSDCANKRFSAWHAVNAQSENLKAAEWREKNRSYFRLLCCESNKRHANRVKANNSARRAVSKKATPTWANKFFLGEAYDLAKLRTAATGIDWHVDHIVPLRSKLVCGLHNEFNIQVVPAHYNRRKGNRYWPDMP